MTTSQVVADSAPMPLLHIRQAVAGDRPALIAMPPRCTEGTRLHRFHGYRRAFPEPYLTEALAGQAEHFALVAGTPEAVVALASCRVVADGATELAVLAGDAARMSPWAGAGFRQATTRPAAEIIDPLDPEQP